MYQLETPHLKEVADHASRPLFSHGDFPLSEYPEPSKFERETSQTNRNIRRNSSLPTMKMLQTMAERMEAEG